MFNKIFGKLTRSIDQKEISYDTAKKIIEKYNDAFLIDVRSKQEYNEGHLDGAINIPLYNIENEIKKFNKNSRLILYCTSGIRSNMARDRINNMGYFNVYNLKKGIENI